MTPEEIINKWLDCENGPILSQEEDYFDFNVGRADLLFLMKEAQREAVEKTLKAVDDLIDEEEDRGMYFSPALLSDLGDLTPEKILGGEG